MAGHARWKEEPFTVRLVTNAGGKVDVELDWLVEQSSLSPFSVIVHRQSPGCGEKGRRGKQEFFTVTVHRNRPNSGDILCHTYCVACVLNYVGHRQVKRGYGPY